MLPFRWYGTIDFDNKNNTFCQASNVVYYIECSVCNLGYAGQTT